MHQVSDQSVIPVSFFTGVLKCSSISYWYYFHLTISQSAWISCMAWAVFSFACPFHRNMTYMIFQIPSSLAWDIGIFWLLFFAAHQLHNYDHHLSNIFVSDKDLFVSYPGPNLPTNFPTSFSIHFNLTQINLICLSGFQKFNSCQNMHNTREVFMVFNSYFTVWIDWIWKACH